MALAFDIGLKRTGVAVAQVAAAQAQAAGTLQVANGQHDWNKVDAVIGQWQPCVIIVGSISNSDPALKKAANRLVSHIQNQHKIKIIQVDETLTTVAANDVLGEQDHSTRKRQTLRDQVAACLILETWLHLNVAP